MKQSENCSRCRVNDGEVCSCTNSTKLQQKNKVNNTSVPSVVIRVETKLPESPHIVDLGDKKPKKVETRLDHIEVFREKMKSNVTHDVIDIGSIVKKTNQQELITKQHNVIKNQEQVINDLLKGKKPSTKVISKKDKKQKKLRKVKIKKIPRAKFFDVKFHKKNKSTKKIDFSYKKFVVSLVAFALIIGLPFPAVGYYKKIKNDQNLIISESTNAFSLLQSSTLSALQANMPVAKQGLQQALIGFSTAENILQEEHQILSSIGELIPFVGEHIRSGRQILQSGQYLALGNTYLVKGLSAAAVEEELPMSDRFLIVKRHLQYAIPQYERALEEISGVNAQILPVEYQTPFTEVKLLLATFVNDLKDLRDLTDAIHTLFGGQELKRYLVIFQNHHEIRPTGGFMGSFALVDVQKGKIMNIEVPEGGTYDLKGQLSEHVEAPLPLQLVNGRWEFQDANWFPDFPASAKKISWFYEHARGATVDGVIAVNASVLERFLRVTGPLAVDSSYDMLLNADSALASLQTEVETGEDKKDNKPKKVISVILSQLLKQLPSLEKVQMISLLGEINESVQQKEIQVFSSDKKVQNKLQEFGWTGNILSTQKGQDYLYVVNTNIQGQKSDAKVTQDVDYIVNVQQDGSMYATVTINRKHIGSPGEQFYGGVNINYLRVYAPLGSELVNAGGFKFPPEEAFHTPEEWYSKDVDLAGYEKEIGYHEQSGTRITNEFGKTTFGNWVIVEPGEEATAFFTYKLPFKVNMNKSNDDKSFIASIASLKPKQIIAHKYSLLLQKQSGVTSNISTRLIYPQGWEPVWKSNDNIILKKDGYIARQELTQDNIIGVVMQKLYD